MRLTENIVLRKNQPRIAAACARYRKKLDSDDCFLIAQMGFLYAMRTWRRGVCAFGPYVEECMRMHIRQGERTRNRLLAAESTLSLDRPVNPREGGDTLGAVFLSCVGDFVDQVIFWDLMGTLDGLPRRVARMHIARCPSQEIMDELLLTPAELAVLEAEIAVKILRYNDETQGFDG